MKRSQRVQRMDVAFEALLPCLDAAGLGAHLTSLLSRAEELSPSSGMHAVGSPLRSLGLNPSRTFLEPKETLRLCPIVRGDDTTPFGFHPRVCRLLACRTWGQISARLEVPSCTNPRTLNSWCATSEASSSKFMARVWTVGHNERVAVGAPVRPTDTSCGSHNRSPMC